MKDKNVLLTIFATIPKCSDHFYLPNNYNSVYLGVGNIFCRGRTSTQGKMMLNGLIQLFDWQRDTQVAVITFSGVVVNNTVTRCKEVSRTMTNNSNRFVCKYHFVRWTMTPFHYRVVKSFWKIYFLINWARSKLQNQI